VRDYRIQRVTYKITSALRSPRLKFQEAEHKKGKRDRAVFLDQNKSEVRDFVRINRIWYRRIGPIKVVASPPGLQILSSPATFSTPGLPECAAWQLAAPLYRTRQLLSEFLHLGKAACSHAYIRALQSNIVGTSGVFCHALGERQNVSQASAG
jgi:hypothetical protein